MSTTSSRPLFEATIVRRAITESFTKLETRYEQRNPSSEVTMSFGGSSGLAHCDAWWS